jgi:phosphoribosylamine--glycine ligase
VADRFEEEGLAFFGASKAAAELENSKSFAKAFLKRHHIPTAEYEVFTQTRPALEYIEQKGTPIVIKADGLASGKGVIVAFTPEEAKSAVVDMLEANRFGDAGARVVIEEYLEGEECSFVVMSDGKNVLPMVPCQDHKRRDEGDKGVNTGGMGAYSPVAAVTPELHARIMKEIIEPTIQAMREKEGIDYKGFLYVGIMIAPDGSPKVLEYNCRFGDPEAQPTMMRLKSDLAKHLLAAVEGRLDQEEAQWDERMALSVVLAPLQYPEKFQGGAVIEGLEEINEPDLKFFHSGTRIDEDGKIVTTVGRILSVTTLAEDMKAAQKKVYETIEKINFKDMYYRKDIGYRSLNGAFK